MLNKLLDYKPNTKNNDLISIYYYYFLEALENNPYFKDPTNYVEPSLYDLLEDLEEDAVFNILWESYESKSCGGFPEPTIESFLDYVGSVDYKEFLLQQNYYKTNGLGVENCHLNFHLSNHELSELKSNFTK